MKRAFTIIGILFLVISGVAQNGSRFSTDLRFNEISINGSTTPELHSGDTLVFTISIENIGNEPYRNCMLSISTNNPSIIFIDSTEYFDYIAPGNEYTLNRCLIAVIAPNIPDRNSILFTFSISNSTEEVLLQRSYRVSGISLTAEHIRIFAMGAGGPQRTLHPSECGRLAITLKNKIMPTDKELKERDRLAKSVDETYKKSEELIKLNTIQKQDQKKYNEEYNALVEESNKLNEKLKTIENKIRDKQQRYEALAASGLDILKSQIQTV